MKWTINPPVRPGWYWFKDRGNEPKCLQVVQSINGKRLLFHDGRLPRDLYMWPGQWAGPIPEPKEGKNMDTTMDTRSILQAESAGKEGASD